MDMTFINYKTFKSLVFVIFLVNSIIFYNKLFQKLTIFDCSEFVCVIDKNDVVLSQVLTK